MGKKGKGLSKVLFCWWGTAKCYQTQLLRRTKKYSCQCDAVRKNGL